MWRARRASAGLQAGQGAQARFLGHREFQEPQERQAREENGDHRETEGSRDHADLRDPLAIRGVTAGTGAIGCQVYREHRVRPGLRDVTEIQVP